MAGIRSRHGADAAAARREERNMVAGNAGAVISAGECYMMRILERGWRVVRSTEYVRRALSARTGRWGWCGCDLRCRRDAGDAGYFHAEINYARIELGNMVSVLRRSCLDPGCSWRAQLKRFRLFRAEWMDSSGIRVKVILNSRVRGLNNRFKQ